MSLLRRLSCLSLIGLALGIGSAASAAEDPITTQVSAFLQNVNQGVGDRVHVTVNLPAAQMSPCPASDPFLPGAPSRTTGRVTVGIHCPGTVPETRYVQADVQVFGSYFAAARDIAAGQTISDADLSERSGEITRTLDRLPGVRSTIVGQQARRRIAESTTVLSDMLAPPTLIRRGDHVKIQARGAGFAVTTRGQALDDAPAGAVVRVRTDSGAVLTGQASDAGVVTLAP